MPSPRAAGRGTQQIRSYVGVDNPLFYKPNTQMLFGDARMVIDAVLTALKK